MSVSRSRRLGHSLALTAGVLSLGAAQAAADAAPGAPIATPNIDPVKAVSEPLDVIDRTNGHAPKQAFDHLAAVASEHGHARAIVGLRTKFTPQGLLSAEEAKAQRETIAAARTSLLQAMAGTDFQVTREFSTLPFIAVKMSREALEALRVSGKAATLTESKFNPAALKESTPLVEATTAASAGRGGAGQTIAILDTGVDSTHPFLRQPNGQSKVIEEACFSVNSDCPNGHSVQYGAGAGRPCAPDCGHGTHVAGIAAGRGPGFSGVAPDANLISIRIFGSGPCKGSPTGFCEGYHDEDAVAGMDRVFALRNTHRIAAVNMSLGGSQVLTSNCDQQKPAYKAAVDNLRSVGIAAVAASGNDASNNGVINSPACVSSAVTVGATTKSDAVAGFSNSSSLVELLAPGAGITSSLKGGGYASWNGTSMATPHVAGAWAIMRQSDPTASVGMVQSALMATGVSVTDPDNKLTRPRIRILEASRRLKPQISIDDSKVAEGDVPVHELAFHVTLSNPVAKTVTVVAKTNDGSAWAPRDYQATGTTVTFAPGETSKFVRVKVNGDHRLEANERMFVVLSSPANADIADGQGEGWILNDDSQAEMACDDVSPAKDKCSLLGPPLP